MVTHFGRKTVLKNWHVGDASLPGFIRIYYVFGGTVCYSDNETKLNLKPGCLYFFSTNRLYRMSQDANNPLQCLFLHMDVTPDAVNHVWEVTLDRFLKHYLNALEDAVLQSNKNLISSMAETLRQYALQKKIIVKPDPRLSDTLIYISRHLAEPLTISELSCMAGYNEQYFIRLFQKTTGLSPYQYILRCRMKEALRLLQENKSVSQTAELVGYSDAKTFTRAFKAQFSMPPSQWRKEYVPIP